VIIFAFDVILFAFVIIFAFDVILFAFVIYDFDVILFARSEERRVAASYLKEFLQYRSETREKIIESYNRSNIEKTQSIRIEL
jgi:protein-S-isoprenylcysteine O-methyltransferase Ste14